MTQYNTLNVKLSYSQLNKLKWGIKNISEVNLKLSSNVVADSNDGIGFLHKLLLIHKFWGFIKPFRIIHQLI